MKSGFFLSYTNMCTQIYFHKKEVHKTFCRAGDGIQGPSAFQAGALPPNYIITTEVHTFKMV